jgi:hypothetical protein
LSMQAHPTLRCALTSAAHWSRGHVEAQSVRITMIDLTPTVHWQKAAAWAAAIRRVD